MKIHGMEGTQIYRLWDEMKQRCFNPNNRSYKKYGARGIRVCERWLNFENFFADMGPKPQGKSLDRIDNNGPYSPGNCRWATPREQLLNTRRNVRWTHNGRTQTISEWAEEIGIHQVTLRLRVVRSGWSIERALTTPVLPPTERRRS